ncbi:MBL fold metallo-hydrolase [Paenibacillus arenosi]|uniref:MBL fold metallo-hydrolase n=1 Tax=Paenibacillus arenosi TaxID=2774142 RepID=A0ABR9B1N8_9BACL|nr:MBL fold metallo-hydrolase [Paenibacillus arenosi]MBD8500296.1 MBL fold metallo-hydrolase [Paenibacillus arenosi]
MAEAKRWQGQAWAEGEHWSITVWQDEHKQLEPIYQIRIPLPFSLRWVNAYAMRESDHNEWTIVDPGLRTPQAEAAWQEVLDKLSIHAGSLRQIVLTHYHPDHLGMAGLLQQKYDVPVVLSRIGWQHAVMLWGDGNQMAQQIQQLMRMQGAPEEVMGMLGEHMDSFETCVSPLPEVTYINDGDELVFGGRTWAAIETHGHAPGHISFYNKEHGLLLAGDHVLPQITPNVSYLPGSDPQPLQLYLEGLKKLSALEVELVLPGHRNPFYQYHARIDYLLQHHEERLAEWHAILVREPMTAYQLCTRIFGNIGRLTVHQFRFAMGETLSHLIELERRGQVHCEHSQGQVGDAYMWSDSKKRAACTIS